MLVIIGGFVTIKFIKPKFEKQKYIIPSDINVSEFVVSDKEKRALWWSGAGLLTALALSLIHIFFRRLQIHR